MAPLTWTLPAVVTIAPLFHPHCAGALYFGLFPETMVQSVVVPDETAAVFFTTSRIIAILPQYAYCAVVISHPDAAVAIEEIVVVAPVAVCPVPPRSSASVPEMMSPAACLCPVSDLPASFVSVSDSV